MRSLTPYTCAMLRESYYSRGHNFTSIWDSYEALHEALHEALRTKTLREALCKALYKALRRLYTRLYRGSIQNSV